MLNPNYNVKQNNTGSYNTSSASKPLPKKNWLKKILPTPPSQGVINSINNIRAGRNVAQTPVDPWQQIKAQAGQPLSMPMFDPYEAMFTGPQYLSSTYTPTPIAPSRTAMPKPPITKPQQYFNRIVINGRTYSVPNQMLSFTDTGGVNPWETTPTWFEPPAGWIDTENTWKESRGKPWSVPSLPVQPGGGGGGGGGGGSYTPMPSSPNYTGYGGGYNRSGSPAAAYYQGRYGGGGYGNGGYVGGQSQRGSWYGALLQWNI